MDSDDEAEEGSSDPQVVPRYFALHDQVEDEVVAAILIQPHPSTTFDDGELRNLVQSSETLALLQKIQLLQGAHLLTQERIDDIFNTLRGEQRTLEALLGKLQAQFAPTDPSAILVEDLSHGTVAGLIYRAIPSLLAPLGMGDAYKFFAAFLKQLVDELRDKPGAVAEGSLQEIFRKQLRDRSVNPDGWEDEGRDKAIIDNLVRPALSNLRAASVEAVVEHGNVAYVASLIIGTPKDERSGRKKSRIGEVQENVRPSYRFKVLVRLDPGETRRTQMMQMYVDVLVDRRYREGEEVLPLARLGVLAPSARRIIERVGYADEGERRHLTFRVIAALINEFSRLLSPPLRLSFLVETLELSVWWRGGVPTAAFESWFLDAVELAPSSMHEVFEGDNEYGHLEYERRMNRLDLGAAPPWWAVFRKRLDRAPFDFATKLLLLRTFYFASGAKRMEMALGLRVFDMSKHQVGRKPENSYQHAGPVRGAFRKNADLFDDLVKIAEAKALSSFD